jgi:hypothetical protein
MANPLNITRIPASRVEVIDPRTGLMARDWYRFFVNLFTLTGEGSNAISIDELQLGPPGDSNLSDHQVQLDLQGLSVGPAPAYTQSDRMRTEYIHTRAVTASDNFAPDDYLVLCNATAGVITLTLPVAAASQGRKLVAKKTDASANAVTVDGNGAETVDGAASISITAQYDSVSVISDGAAWWIV